MRQTDVLIAGGGLAGSIAAVMLARAGHDVILVDPHEVYPVDFRCEKLDGPQIELLRKTGLADTILRVATHDRDVWVARLGRLLEHRPSDQYGIDYDVLVNTVRAEIPASVPFISSKVASIAPTADRQTVTLANGEQISARLVIVASGLSFGVREALGIKREVISPSHSITIGFDVAPVGRPAFDFRALSYYAENVAGRVAYISLFPIGSRMRANLFVYRDMQDTWLRDLRAAPVDTLYAAMPGLEKLMGDFEVTSFVKIRPVDLYVTDGYRQPGIVLVGDAFGTACPAAGTGARKAICDVERLCNVYIPRWLASPGMGADKIAAFYDDPVKQESDASSLAKAYAMRSISIDPSLPWAVRRWARFFVRLGIGTVRHWRRRLSGTRLGADEAVPVSSAEPKRAS